MGKILVIAEKPSVGRDIARVLGCKGRGDGYLYSDEHVVSWAIGHLVTLCEPEDYDTNNKSWRMDTLPIVPEQMRLKAIESTKTQLIVLKKLMNAKDIDSLICATDSGREGELIFRYIYSFVGSDKPFARLWISSMTDKAIKDGFANLKDGHSYDNLYESARCRSEADWLVGINATRTYTIRYSTLLSVGRVQTPTLAILVERQKEINAFVPEDYWEIKAVLNTDTEFSGTWIDPETRATKISDKEKAEAIKDKVYGKSGAVESIEAEEKKQLPGQLYDLTELQRDCNKKFGYSAKKTLELAQALYEKRKMITYPRTDSRYLSDDFIPKLSPLLQKLVGTEYKEYSEYVLGLPKLPITKRIVDSSKVSDHHAIIPTENVNTSSLGAEERNVYDLIMRKFIGVFYPAYICNITRVITCVAGELFMSRGSVVVQLGFMELYKNEPVKDKEKGKNSDEDDGMLPPLNEKDEVVLKECSVAQKKTTPPKAYTEASLLSAMENAGRFVDDEVLKEQLKASGLGTPATRAAIIERLIQVGYVVRKGKALTPTDKAMKLISIVPPELRSPETTGKWEKGLSSIANGGMDSNRFMGSITRYVEYIIAQSRTAARVSFTDMNK